MKNLQLKIKMMVALLLPIFLSINFGCTPNNNPVVLSGAWKGELKETQTLLATGDIIEVDISEADGTISGKFARLTTIGNNIYTTENLSGTKIGDEIDLSIDFNPDYDVVIEFSGMQVGNVLNGMYSVIQGGTLVETGTVQFNKFFADSLDLTGSWSGTYLVTGGRDLLNQGSWAFEVEQIGNNFNMVGSIDGIDATGDGSIVGNSVAFGTVLSELEIQIVWGGNTNNTGTTIEGNWVNDIGGTFGTFAGTKND